MNPENLINWGELSRLLSGKRTSLYRNRIPKKHEKAIRDLIGKIEDWEKQFKPAEK